jgi:heat shock protein HtpX
MLRTTLLLAALTGLIMAIGYWLGGPSGLVIAFVFAVIMNFGSYWFSDKIVLAAYGAQPIAESEAPGLYQIVRQLSQREGIPMPRLYLIPSEAANAFATGRNPEHAVVAVTQGILQLMNERELTGVLAHELAHVRNRDILISSIAATLGGVVMLLANFAQWSLFFGGMGRSSDREGGGNPIGVLLTALLAPLAATLIQLAISRTREYAADETGAHASGDPLALASALQKLGAASQARPLDASPQTAHLFIVNPLFGRSLMQLFSTHPSLEDRVARLYKLAGR